MNANNIHPLRYSVHTRLREFHLKQLLPDRSNGYLLDIGCGLGYLTEKIGNGFIRVGMDSDLNALRLNYNRGLKNMVQGDIVKLPFKKQSIDVITCSEVLEHLPEGMDRSLLFEMSSILKPGGRLLITVPSLEGIRAKSNLRNLGHHDPSGGEYHHRIGYTWKDIDAMINNIPALTVRKKQYAMFLFSELFMDLVKWVYFRKNKFKEHSDIIGIKESLIFRLYRLFFPLLYLSFICEDIFLASIFKGHILILSLERTDSV
jgi:SAM-dependent methyltransferase